MTLKNNQPESSAAEVADHWAALMAAAEAGDEAARAFLETFGPWAKAQVDSVPKN